MFVNLKLINYQNMPLSFSRYKDYLCSHDEYKAWLSPVDTLSSTDVKEFALLYPQLRIVGTGIDTVQNVTIVLQNA